MTDTKLTQNSGIAAESHHLYYSRKPETPKRNAKTLPANIERHVFAETRLTAYRLKDAA